ncbi:unnamed protein product [Pleuronectes platessa]|uniref:Uncharacterized protein n=1 Tax=Pleuronectes platessa TaxID=8262 RepID=A0A9N7UEX7_PLEPL|nr:unnamed protein product [Pleuronectes platessa]
MGASCLLRLGAALTPRFGVASASGVNPALRSGAKQRSRASVAAPWIAVCGSRTGGRGGGPSVAHSVSRGLIVVLVADPVSRWHWVRAVDQDRGGGSWWVLVGGGSWSYWLLTMDCDCSGTAWHVMLGLSFGMFTLINAAKNFNLDDIFLHVASIALLSVLGEGSLTCGSL